jgi:hypothetical protein
MFKDLSPIAAYKKLKPVEKGSFHQALFSISGVIFLITLLYWPVAYFIRKEYKQPIGSHLTLRTKLVGWFGAFSFILAFVLILAATSNQYEIVFGIPATLKVALVFPVIGVILTILGIYQLFKLWALRKNNWSGILHFTLLVVALLITVWQFSYWNLLGFQY